MPPLLVVVSGPPGSGTTTLARALSRGIPCPAISRDEIKEGLVDREAEYTPVPGDALSWHARDAFFGVVRFLIDAGVTVVAESAFQRALWEPGLQPLAKTARIRVVHCRVDPAVAWKRIAGRAAEDPARRAVHGDHSLDEPYQTFASRFDSFDPIALPVPSIEVDTTDGYNPDIAQIVAFVKARDP